MKIQLNAINWADSADVSSLNEASDVFVNWIDDKGYGSSHLDFNCGLVTDRGKPVAYISYNGRIWEAEEFESGHYRGNGVEIVDTSLSEDDWAVFERLAVEAAL